MRKSLVAALALATVLSATPVLAASASRGPRPVPVMDKIVMTLQRVFRIRGNAEPIVPIPAPTTRTSTSSTLGTGK